MTPLSTTHRTWALAALLWGCAASPTWAHDGEDHGTGPAPAPTVATAPRAVAQTDAFELVATLDGQTLTLTLDHFATNEPVANAQIELEAGPLKAMATPVSYTHLDVYKRQSWASPATHAWCGGQPTTSRLNTKK